MNATRRATLFTNGRNQAIRIPRDFELPGKEALIRKEGERLIIEPVPPPRLLAVLAPLDEAFPYVDDRPPEPVDLKTPKAMAKPTYLLDTNSLSDLVQHPAGRIAEHGEDSVSTSIVVARNDHPWGEVLSDIDEAHALAVRIKPARF